MASSHGRAVKGVPAFPFATITSADVGMESTDPTAHVDAEVNWLYYFDTSGNYFNGWNSSNYHPTTFTKGNFSVGWITQYTDVAVSGNVCSSTSPKRRPVSAGPATERDVDNALHRLATTNSESTPQNIEAVRTSKSVIEQGAGSTATKKMVSVFTVQAEGDFVVEEARVPRGKVGPHGKYLTVSIEESTGEVLDWGISLHPIQMSQLGAVKTLR